MESRHKNGEIEKERSTARPVECCLDQGIADHVMAETLGTKRTMPVEVGKFKGNG